MEDDIESEDIQEFFKIIIIGDSNVGKTQILNSYLKEFKKDVKSTVGTEFEHKYVYIENKVIKFQFWDTAGEERYKSIIKNYYKNARGVFIVYDITNQESFNSIEYWFNSINEIDAETSLIANKCDLLSERKIKCDEGEKKASKYGSAFYEVSAFKKINIDTIFNDLMNRVYRKYKANDKYIDYQKNHINLNDQNEKYQNCCY